MTKDNRIAIIRDIFALYQKYDEREISEAIQYLTSGNPLGELLHLIETSKKLKYAKGDEIRRRRSSRAVRATPSDYLKKFILGLDVQDENKHEDIRRFLIQLQERQLLQSASLLKEFASAVGIAVPTTKADRFVIARKIGEVLLQMSLDERKKYLELASQISTKSSSLQAWSDIIVKR